MSKLANFVKETTSTFGTGVIVLTGAVEGFTTFSSAFGAETIYYAITDGTNKEIGLGSFNGSDTITRTTILATLTSGTYDTSSPSPLSLSGGAIVACALEADFALTAEHANRSVLDNTTASFTTALETKLSGIETLADVTDATNVAAAGAVMYTDANVSTASWVIDEDTMVSSTDLKVPTQQSVKAYVDGSVVTTGSGIITSTASFNGVLSGSDTNVQLALDTIDDHAHEGTEILATGVTDGYVLSASSGSSVWVSAGGAGVVWGDLTGTLSNQTDLQSALDAKLDSGDIGVTIQGYDATLLNDADIGASVQAYDADTAKTDVAQTFTASQRGTVTADNDLSFDLSVTNNFSCTPTAGGALTFTNHTAGQSGLILFVNGSDYAITAAATTYISAADLIKLSATGVYLITYFDNGTNAYCAVSAALTSGGV